jgi:hypothetical protein
MDLGDYQHLNEYEGPDRNTEVERSFVERPTSRPTIRRKPLSTDSIELASLHSHSSQRPLLNTKYEESIELFVPSNAVRKGPWKEQTWQWGKQLGSGTHPAWFTTVTVGLILAIIVFLMNVSLLAWSYKYFSVEKYTAVVFTGSCGKTSTFTAAAELAINIISTLLLAASNNCAQLLISPTRTKVDKAHEQGVWIHVGPANARNFKWIGKWRVATWCQLKKRTRLQNKVGLQSGIYRHR